MTDLLAGLPIGGISAGALVGIVCLMVLTGRLVPRQQLLDTREDRDQWRSSAETSHKAVETLVGSVQQLIVYAETTNHALTEIQSLAARAGPES